MQDNHQDPVRLGLLYGAMLGAVLMMIFGGLGWTDGANMALLLGVLAGPSIGYLLRRMQERKARRTPPDAGDRGEDAP